MDEPDTNPEETSSPNKRQKTLTPTQSPLSSSKGKEKIEEIEDENEKPVDSDSQICGICFEEGKSIRGWIDSCNHYFCFVCIMEWSKHESRCPMCKQRFKTILRKPKAGVFLQERVVNVPERNQVWHPLGNQTTEVSDPYAEVNCIECQSSSDEHLLLLCDLCDSAAHTFCVGLGYTVPEGDWYCNDCTVTRNEHSSSEIDIGYQDSDVTTVHDATSIPISEIVQESDVQILHRSTRRRTSSRPNKLPTRVPRREHSSTTAVTARPRQLSSHVPGRDVSSRTAVIDSGARTLSHCRSVHNHVQVLRQNWGALRNGSVSFSANVSKSDRKNDKKQGKAVVHEKSGELRSSSSMNCNGNSANDNASSDVLNRKSPYDINRAWKMLDIAKSVQKACEARQSGSNQVSNHQAGARDLTMASRCTGSTVSLLKSKIVPQKDLRRTASEKDRCQSVEISQQNHRSQTSDQIWPSMSAMDTSRCQSGSGQVSNHPVGTRDLTMASRCTSSTISLPKSHIVPQKDLRKTLSQKDKCQSVEISQQKHRSQVSDEMWPSKNAMGTSHSQRPPTTPPLQPRELPLAKQVHRSDQVHLCRKNSGDDNRVTSNMSRRPNLLASYSKEELPKEGGVDKICAEVIARKDNDAKSEVQSLVKLNLKLLSRDKQLGVNGFKEVARLATHTILSACGLEHKQSSVRPFPDTICQHNDQTKQMRMSNLMPKSCRECFYAFVKDVVSSIVAEETARTQ